MSNLKKYAVEVQYTRRDPINEIIYAKRYTTEAGSVDFYIDNPENTNWAAVKIKSFPAPITTVTLVQEKEVTFVDNLEQLSMRRSMNGGKIIELDDGVIKVLTFISSKHDEISTELANTQKGEVIYGRYNRIEGFISNLNDDLKISFQRLSNGSYIADICFFYKDLCVMSAKILSDNDHWNGKITSIELYDSYAREESRHELEKPFQQYLTWIVNTIYNPMMEKTNDQKLFKDNLYDEYIKTIEE